MNSEEIVNNLRMEKQNAFDSLYEKYKLSSFYHSFQNLGNHDKMLNLQQNLTLVNNQKIRNIQSDLDTLEKQLLLSNNEFFLRNNQIRILKVVFYFLLLTLGNIVLHKSELIPTKVLYIIQLVLTIVFAIILIVQIKWNNLRDKNDFRRFNWEIPSETSSETLPEEKNCIPNSESTLKSKTKLNIII